MRRTLIGLVMIGLATAYACTYVTCKNPSGLLGALSKCATNQIGTATQLCQSRDAATADPGSG